MPPECEGGIGSKQVKLPYTLYGFRYIYYETENGGMLLHLYLREIAEINSATKGRVTYKYVDVADEFIEKFKEMEEWELLFLGESGKSKTKPVETSNHPL